MTGQLNNDNGLQAWRTNTTSYNSTYKKLAVQWFNEVLCFVSASLLADSLVLRNRQLLVAAKRWVQGDKKQNLRNYEN